MSDTVKLNPCPKCGAPIPAEAPQGLCPKCVLVGAATATESGVPATATSEIPSLERVAAAFPQLEILELIGRGGMGFVFKARQPHLDRFVALKLLPDKLARDPRFTERFNREGRVLAKLNHPNIVSVYDFGQTEHFYFLLMEFVDGVNLRQAMKAGRFSPAEALAIVPRICEALQYAHGQGILHRDIKPENILLDARGNVKIADFGIAKLVGEEKPDVVLTATGAALGTPHYMAPEQLEHPLTVDHRADIYSLGVVFYEMLTGELPIGRFAAPSSKTPVGANVDEVVFRTLEKDRERRYQSAGEMQTQVEHLGCAGAAAAGVVTPQPAGAHAVVPEWSRKAVWGAVLTALSLPLPLLMAVWLYFARAGGAGLGVGELILGMGAIVLPALAGTLLGWIALSDIGAHRGQLRGTPLAVFAAVTWPALALAAFTVWLVVAPARNFSATAPLASFLLLLVPAGMLTFLIWAIYATTNKAAGEPVNHRRGVLKWAFISLLMSGIGYVLVLSNKPQRTSSDSESATIAPDIASIASQGPTDSNAWIRFTFTAVELRDIAGARWLAIDYMDDVHGDCQQASQWEATIPGFKAETRTSHFVKDYKDSPAVRHQRIEFRLPDSAPREQLDTFRENVEQALKQKSVRLDLEEPPFLLFELPGAEGGLLKAWVKVVPPLNVPTGPTAAMPNANHPGASAELWSPNLAPGEKPNLSDILQEARSLAQEGRHEEALQRHLWYHNHALEFEPGQAGVRLSFALSYWVELARRYPKAKEALVEIRDRGEREFAGGGGYPELFSEISAINGYLGQKEATLALFKSIQSRDPRLARQCYRSAEELLVEAGDYALCASFVPDFQKRFESIRAVRERMLKLADRTPEVNQTSMREQAARTFVKDTRQLVEILVGTGRKADAEKIRDQAVAVLNVPELQSAVSDAEQKLASRSAPAR
jgi:tRNA A-37 threonylcarbamoyl transferase component Bud32